MERIEQTVIEQLAAAYERDQGLNPTMASLPATEHFRPRPVMSRLQRRWTTHAVGPPTEEEKRDAIIVLSEGWFADAPLNDPLYVEAERIFEEAGR